MKRAPSIHQRLDRFQEKLGQTLAWGVLAMAALTFVTVVLRYGFSLGWVWLQEVVIYLHATTFLLSAAWVLNRDGHVRVDVLYRSWSSAKKKKWDRIGIVALLLPTAGLIFWKSLPYVADSWRVFEGSGASGGLPLVFLLKSLLLVFPFLLIAQAVISFFRSAPDVPIFGPGKKH